MFQRGSGRFRRSSGDRKKPMKMPKIFKIDEKGLKWGVVSKMEADGLKLISVT